MKLISLKRWVELIGALSSWESKGLEVKLRKDILRENKIFSYFDISRSALYLRIYQLCEQTNRNSNNNNKNDNYPFLKWSIWIKNIFDMCTGRYNFVWVMFKLTVVQFSFSSFPSLSFSTHFILELWNRGLEIAQNAFASLLLQWLINQFSVNYSLCLPINFSWMSQQ